MRIVRTIIHKVMEMEIKGGERVWMGRLERMVRTIIHKAMETFGIQLGIQIYQYVHYAHTCKLYI